MLATMNGHLAVVKLLFEHDEVSLDISDLSGGAALELAASHGHTKVVDLLPHLNPRFPCQWILTKP